MKSWSLPPLIVHDYLPCLAARVQHRMNVAKVDVDLNEKLAARFKVTQCPSAALYVS